MSKWLMRSLLKNGRVIARWNLIPKCHKYEYKGFGIGQLTSTYHLSSQATPVECQIYEDEEQQRTIRVENSCAEERFHL